MLTRPALSSLSFSLATAGALVITASCAQPDLNCASAYGTFAAEYTLAEGDPSSPCGQLAGDRLGMQTYFQAGGRNNTPNYQDAEVAIRPESLGAKIAYAEARGVGDGEAIFYDANAVGSFTQGFPNEDDFCMARDFEDVQVSLPLIPELMDDPDTPDEDESQPAQPAIDIRYQWSDARFLVSADAQGTQFEAELVVEQDGCRAEYLVRGPYPAVACESNEDCTDEANGINPDFAVRCHAQLGLCVLDGDLPAYEDAT